MSIYSNDDQTKVFDLSFEEIGENFLSGVVFTKIEKIPDADLIDIELQLSDVFYFNSLDEPVEKYEVSTPSKGSFGLDIEKFVHLYAGLDAPTVTYKKESFEEFFGSWFNRTLGYMRDGDSCGTNPVIDAFEQCGSDKTGTPIFKIRITKNKFIEGFRKNIINQVYFGEESYTKLINLIASPTPAIAPENQLGYLRTFLESRVEKTGETQFGFLLNEFNFRRSMMTLDTPGGLAMIPSPLSTGAGVKVSLPFLLAIQGEFDIHLIKIATSPFELDRINILYSIHKPAIKNTFSADFCSLPIDTRERMSAVEISNYEKVSKALQKNHCFHNSPALESDFIKLSTWAIKKISYCLEEPSYLKSKVQRWIAENKETSYKKMEDDLFLPFIYEDLRERFGDIVQKKPERFGGNVDILFGSLPVELKVRKGHKEALIDKVVDEKYKPTSQAAAYAAITRLGFVFVLDIPTSETSITNITSCIKVITKNPPEAELPTSVIVFVFQCNTPKPSSAT